MKSVMALAAIGVALAAGAAQAGAPKAVLGRMTIGYTYYNKAGADVAAHDADVKACAVEGSKLTWTQEAMRSQPTYTGQGVLGDALGNAMNADVAMHGHFGAVASGVENCMVVRGWRVVMLSENEGIALSKLGQEALAAKLAPWIGAAEPHGKVVRVFRNEASFGATQRLVSWPQSLDSEELSLKAATGRSFTDYMPMGLGGASTPTSGYSLFSASPATLLAPAAVAAGQPDKAIVIVSTANFGAKSGPSLILAAAGGPAGELGSAPVFVDARLMRKGPPYAAFAVRPGKWRIGGFGGLNFCLGAPAFEVKAGEVVYAGGFDFAAPELGPNLTLDGPKAWLAGTPAAEALRPAAYVNGALGDCGGYTIYALEVKGAPFEAGYAWGSAAAPAAAGAAAP